jgi:parvulin-like peptidyl-prolyl isomerase
MQAPQAQTAAPVQVTGRPVLRINGVVLTDRDLQREIYAIFPYANQHGGGVPKGMEAQIHDGAIKMMTFEELAYQEALRRKLVVTPERKQHALAEFRKQFHSGQEYQQFLQSEFQGSQRALQTKIERSLLIEQLLKTEVADKAAVSLPELRAYYDKNPDQFRVPESFAFQSISMIPPPNAQPAQLQEAQRKAEKVLPQAKATKSYQEFGLLAEKLSEDDFRVMMGDHKVADRSKLPPEVVAALLSMKLGQVSELVHFEGAYTILRLNAHIPAGLQKFDDVKSGLRERLAKKKTEQLRAALDKRLRASAKIEEL